ncbi:hypothetical protein [Thalassospira aquimaris]|uniref:Peptidase n=1 Tax=Thalassospira aquimaris TaxID=3037796 RepID=A0ABT6GIE8_9PROT|nr:hypothetical protein [Thalassospira sp. FZY0004]MDG4721592.1 hypothetical protein [Thalassospira sp. FZY0004]
MTDPNIDPGQGAPAPAPEGNEADAPNTPASDDQDGGVSLELPEGNEPGSEATAIPEGYFKVPGDDASDDDRAAFRAAIGVPETAEGYLEGLDLPEGYTPPAYLAEAALAAGIPVSGLQSILKADAENTASYMAELEAAAAKEQQDTAAALKKEWGKDAAQNITLANRVVQKYAPEGFGEFMKKTGLHQDARFIKFAHALAGAVGESAFVDGDGGKGEEKTPQTLQEALYSKD